MKRNKKSFILGLVLLLFLLAGLNAAASYAGIRKTVEDSIARQALQSAESIASALDTQQYSRFLTVREKNSDYWEITSYLADAREKTGALYVYTLEIRAETAHVMIAGQQRNAKQEYEIGALCTVPKKQVQQARQGLPYITGILEDPVYKTSYLSVGAPIIDQNGKTIGYLGIDMGTAGVNEISRQILTNSEALFAFSVFFVFLVLGAVLLFQRWHRQEKAREVKETEVTYQSEFTSLIASAQLLKHDFANHLQVLHGLLKIEEPEKALEYSSSLMKEARSVEANWLHMSNPGLSILLQTKKLAAENESIPVSFHVSNHSFDQIKTVDLIKILSNLIDNAIDATKELPPEKRSIVITAERNSRNIVFQIRNTGPGIRDETKIFQRGYSTKQKKEGPLRGQGLFIVKEIAAKYDGHVTLYSIGGETTALVTLPAPFE